MNAVCSEVRVSCATANAIGLSRGRNLVEPTTAYLMTPFQCIGNCIFCSQKNGADRLSRVLWPVFKVDTVFERLSEYGFSNICLQVTKSQCYIDYCVEFADKTEDYSIGPVSLSIDLFFRSDDIAMFLKKNVRNIALSIDCISEKDHGRVKGGDLQHKTEFLFEAAQSYPGRISTHIIIGLGETDRQVFDFLTKCHKADIPVGIFALTETDGMRMPYTRPTLKRYRAIQAMNSMIRHSMDMSQICFDKTGNLISLAQSIPDLLRDGSFIRTAGCQGCNRPFYNESPSGVWYNYPRKLKESEALRGLSDISGLFTGNDD